LFGDYQNSNNKGLPMAPKITDLLAEIPLLAKLPREDTDAMIAATSLRTVPKGETLVTQGQTNIPYVFIVAKGVLALYDERETVRKPTGYIKKGEVFGTVSILMNGGTALRTAVAHKTCVGYTIPRDLFEDLSFRHPDLFTYFLDNFSHNIFDPSLLNFVETGQTKHFLTRIDPFKFLPPDDIAAAAKKLQLVHHPRGAVLFVQGRSRVGYLYILKSGAAERYVKSDEQRIMVDRLGPGDIYGGISILVNDSISVRTVEIIAESSFYLLPRDHFLKIAHNHPAFADFFTDTFGKRMTERTYASLVAKSIRPIEGGTSFFSQPVVDICNLNPIFGKANMTIRESAQIMREKRMGALFLKDDFDECVGVITERDLSRRVIATGMNPEEPTAKIMSAPVQATPWNAPVFEACLTMLQSDIRHLAVTDTNDAVMGLLSTDDLLMAQGQSPLFILQKLAKTRDLDEAIEIKRQLPVLVRNLITSGAKAQNLTRFISSVADTILQKVMKVVSDEMGPPPARFVFMIMGSEGRLEQTLKTDQDNAIIYDDVPQSDEKKVHEYFLKLGESACALLDKAGYDFCKGKVMAMNPKWCQPLGQWKEYFRSWIYAARAEDLLNTSIFFDFREGYGDIQLTHELKIYLFETLEGWAGFLRHLTENALHFRPPIGFFRNFVVESEGEHRDKLNLKGAMMPITDFARIYALKNGIEETNTLERLHHLQLKKILSDKEYEELERAYSLLMQLRLSRQVKSVLDEERAPGNHIDPEEITHIEQTMLKEAFRRIEKFQSKMEFDFIGLV